MSDNFASKYDENDNVTLMLDEKPLIVSKPGLAMHSPVFGAMFYNKDFAESKMSIIPLKDVNYDEFVAALELIFPREKKSTITAHNVKSLLIIGDRFEMMLVMQQCQNFLIQASSSIVGTYRKIIYAARFDLQELLSSCRRDLTWSELRELIFGNDEYKELNSDQKNIIVEHFIKIARRCCYKSAEFSK